MTKYYYDDPLAAAYMAREFSVVYHYSHRTYNWSDINWLLLIENQEEFIIHPDSLHIFDPKEGDLVNFITKIGYVDHCGQIAQNEWNEVVCYNIKTDDYKIIQRDGKSFFWPKIEEED